MPLSRFLFLAGVINFKQGTLDLTTRDNIASSSIDIENKSPINITVSFGIAAIEPDISVEEAIEHADNALYKAKNEGRNCTRIWS